MPSFFRVREERSGDVAVLHAEGKITIGAGDLILREALYALVAAGVTKIALVLTDVTGVDSSGLGELVTSYTMVTRTGGRLVLVAPTQKVTDILTSTKLITVFPVVATVEEALAELTRA